MMAVKTADLVRQPLADHGSGARGRSRLLVLTVMIASLALPLSSARAADGLEAAYPAPGDIPTLAHRALSCISQIPSGATDAPRVVSSDLPGGQITAAITFEYIGAGAIPTTVRGRSTLTLMAAAGGFKVRHTAVQSLVGATGWRPNDDPYITARRAEIDEDLAACMQRAAAP